MQQHQLVARWRSAIRGGFCERPFDETRLRVAARLRDGEHEIRLAQASSCPGSEPRVALVNQISKAFLALVQPVDQPPIRNVTGRRLRDTHTKFRVHDSARDVKHRVASGTERLRKVVTEAARNPLVARRHQRNGAGVTQHTRGDRRLPQTSHEGAREFDRRAWMLVEETEKLLLRNAYQLRIANRAHRRGARLIREQRHLAHTVGRPEHVHQTHTLVASGNEYLETAAHHDVHVLRDIILPKECVTGADAYPVTFAVEALELRRVHACEQAGRRKPKTR